MVHWLCRDLAGKIIKLIALVFYFIVQTFFFSVVTGARFVRQGPDSRTCHYFLNLQSARLLPFGLIDQETLEWEPLPTTNSFTLVNFLSTGCKNFSELNIVITGAMVIEKIMKRISQGFIWNQEALHKVVTLQIIGRRFHFETGELYGDELTLDLVEENAVTDFTSDTMVKEAVAISSVQKHQRSFLKPEFCFADFSSSTVTSLFPVAAINIMSNRYEETNFFRTEIVDHFCLYLKSLDYKKLLEL